MTSPERQDHPDPSRCAPGCAELCTPRGLATSIASEERVLFHRALHRLGDAGLAEEAVQETFTRAWRSCHRFDGRRGARRSWLLAIEANIIIDLARARARRPPLSTGPEAEAGPREADERHARDPIEGLVNRATTADLLGRLSPDHRVAIVETLLRDRPYEEVASELGIAPGTLKSRVFYGLRRLRVHVTAAGGTGLAPGRLAVDAA